VRRAIAAIGLTSGLLLTGIVAHAAPRAAAATPAAAAQGVLDARVAAVTSGDRSGFLATVDPEAPAAFRDAQARQFDGLRSVPLASYALAVRLDDTGDLAGPAGLSPRYGGAPTFLPETRLRYRLRDYDERDDVASLFLTFVQRGGRWFVGGDADLASLGLLPARFLWDDGPVRVHPTAHFLVLSHPEDADRADALAAIAEDAMVRLTVAWDQPWSQRIPLILPHSIDELAGLIQSTFDLSRFVAFVNYGAVRDTGYEPTAPRIYIQDRNLRAYPRDFQVQTLTHELDHAAAAPLAGPLIPAWVHEGVADWIAKGRPTGERKPGGSDGVLPRDYEFVTGGSGTIVRAYSESRSAISYLASRFGLGAPSRFFATLGAARVAPGDADYQTDAALRRVTAIGLADLQRGWARR
jgi:hypothetical protein